jgi:hypothetical protein
MPDIEKPKWKYINAEGEEEDVEAEEWHWEAEYKDGTVLKQYDDAGVFHQFKEINFSQVKTMSVTADGTSQNTISVNWKPEYTPIFFYRNVTYHAGKLDQDMVRLYCFGYDDGTGKKKIHVIKPGKKYDIVDDENKAAL